MLIPLITSFSLRSTQDIRNTKENQKGGNTPTKQGINRKTSNRKRGKQEKPVQKDSIPSHSLLAHSLSACFRLQGALSGMRSLAYQRSLSHTELHPLWGTTGQIQSGDILNTGYKQK